MPISSIGSYLPTMQEFIAHWTQVNATLGSRPLTLKGGYSLADFTGDRAALQYAISAIDDAETSRQLATNDREIKKDALKTRLTQFRAAVRHLLTDTMYDRSLPTLPQTSSVESRFLRPFDEMAALWNKINIDPPPEGFTPPLLLTGPYNLADFRAELAALRVVFANHTNTTTTTQINREQRDSQLGLIDDRLKQYRLAVPALLGTSNPLTASMPTVSAPAGSTPDAITVSGAWDAARNEAILTWTASDNPNLDHYSVRTAPGPSYKAADERALGVVPAGTTTFATAAGLSAPGSMALFKVYVITDTLNEKGSNTLKVTRPA